jgi:hypothetical protein
VCDTCDETLVRDASIALAVPTQWLSWGLLLSSAVMMFAAGSQALGVSWARMPNLRPVGLALDLVPGVAFIVWFRRANRALAERKFDLEFGPNAWVWNYVPFANLLLPYRVLHDIYERVVVDAGFALPAWWGLKLLGGFLMFCKWGTLPLWPYGFGALAASQLVLWRVVQSSTASLSRPIRSVEVQPSASVRAEPIFSDFL